MQEKSLPWYQRSYRRILLDFHIPDWNPDFLSEFDPEEFAKGVVEAGATAATLFANTHTGLASYPSKVGAVHKNLADRDVYGEAIDACHRHGLDVIVYYCTIYTDWYWDTHPEARIVDGAGKSEKLLMGSIGTPRRFSVLCPNNPGYRKFVTDQLNELCDLYEFEGVWPDMTFWPTACFCDSCRDRYRREKGRELPTTIDWFNREWVEFQRTRERWLSEFIALVTDTIKKKKPSASVAHQSHTYHGSWLMGPSVEAAEHTDWLSADLYGEKFQLSFASKLFHGLSKTLPFEHLNTWAWPNIHEHIIARTTDEMRMDAFASFVNNGAMVFIDAIDPVGRVHREIYRRIRTVYDELARYEQYAGGSPRADVAVYYSFESHIDLRDNGKDVEWIGFNFQPRRRPDDPAGHRQAAVNATKSLMQAHIPYWVITRKDLSRLSEFRTIILPNVVVMDDEEIAAIRAYVEAGGTVYASKLTSLLAPTGAADGTTLRMQDLFGVRYNGTTAECLTYAVPTNETLDRPAALPGFSRYYPCTIHDHSASVQLSDTGADVLADLVLPYTEPTGTKYASILTDPPGRPTDSPAIVMRRAGKGLVMYSAGVLEAEQHASQRELFVSLVKKLGGHRRSPWSWDVGSGVPAAVEATVFDRDHEVIVHLLNYQTELPNIPVRDVSMSLALRDASGGVEAVFSVTDNKNVDHTVSDGRVRFTIPEVRDYHMVRIVLRRQNQGDRR